MQDAALPAPILAFVRDYHVLSLATWHAGELWAASCFYAVDEAHTALLILSSEQTRHGLAMRQHSEVAGTIAGQPKLIPAIRGVQFRATALLLDGPEQDAAYALYCQRHPIARLQRSAIWRLDLQEVKYTDNRKIFASKQTWLRPAAG